MFLPNTSNSPCGAGELAVAPTMAAVACAYARATGTMPTSFPINHTAPWASRRCRSNPPRRSPHQRPQVHLLKEPSCPPIRSSSTASRSAWTSTATCGCCGCCATSSASPGRSTAAACGSAGRAPATSTAWPSTPAAVPVSQIKPTDEITTIEGLPATVDQTLHPMQQAWLDPTSPSAATASPARSWPRWPWSSRSRPRAARSPRRTWTASATSAGAAPTSGSARPSSAGPRNVRLATSTAFPTRSTTLLSLSPLLMPLLPLYLPPPPSPSPSVTPGALVSPSACPTTAGSCRALSGV